MARLQSLTQQHFLERQAAPLGSRMFSGLSGTSEGVPRMHPLKSSMPVMKAGSLIHGLRLKSMARPASLMKMPRMGSLMKMPRLGGMR